MKTLYFDVSAGAAGDMLMGALYGLCRDRSDFLDTMNALPLPGIALRPEPREDGFHMAVTFHGMEEGEYLDGHPHHHHHRTLDDVLELIRCFPLEQDVLTHACGVYQALAEAEGFAHGVPVGEVHFHEVGMNDAIADVVGVSLLIHWLAPDMIACGPVAVGCGTVRCAHGELPVPAPATARLLEGLPVVSGPGTGELCTPTGAALIRHFVRRFETLNVPDDAVSGYGSRHFDTHKNAVAAWITQDRP